MVKDCKNCIHDRVCKYKGLNPEYKEEMRRLIEKWGNLFSEDCPEWHPKETPVLRIKEMSESERDEIIKAWNEQERIQPWINTKTSIVSDPMITYDYKTDNEIISDKEEIQVNTFKNLDKTMQKAKSNFIEKYDFVKELDKSMDRVGEVIKSTKAPKIDNNNNIHTHECIGSEHCMDMSKTNYEDEVMVTKAEEKEKYDFVKELEKALGFHIKMDNIRGL